MTLTDRPAMNPCRDCGAPAIRELCDYGYCPTHLAALYRTFDPAVFQDGGIGLPAGAQRPELGPAIEDLECCRCGATWAGMVGDWCWWCQRSLELQTEEQARMVLQIPDVDPDDIRFEDRMKGWADRMAVAVTAGIITQRQADRAWARAMKKAAA